MLFTISKASDSFMSEGSYRLYPPHPSAIWNDDLCAWTVLITSLNEFKGLSKGKIDLVLKDADEIVPHIEINDMVEVESYEYSN